jgi:hypothetical protein
VTLYAQDEHDARQAEVEAKHEAGLRWEGKHPEQIEARKAERERQISLEARALRERADSEAAKRGYSFDLPAVPGEGWATGLLKQKLLGIFCMARDKFVSVIEAEERIALAKRKLGGTTLGLVTPNVELHDLREERSRLDIAEAHFEAALAECEKRREQLADPEFLSNLEAANAFENPFSGYVEADMPEEKEIATAVTMYLEACARVRAKHEAALDRNSQAVRSALGLGLTMHELPDMHRELSPSGGFGVVHRAAVRAANDARRRLFGGDVQPLQDFGVKDWHDPYVV